MGEKGLLLQGINLLTSSLIAVTIFMLISMQLKLPELEILFTKINSKFSRK